MRFVVCYRFSLHYQRDAGLLYPSSFVFFLEVDYQLTHALLLTYVLSSKEEIQFATTHR